MSNQGLLGNWEPHKTNRPMKQEHFDISYEQYGRLMAKTPAWLFMVIYSDLTIDEILSEDYANFDVPTFLFDNARQTSDCFFTALENTEFDSQFCGLATEDEYNNPWSYTCRFNQFKLDGKVFDVHYHNEDCEDHIHTKEIMEISYSPVCDCDDPTKYISWMMKNHKRFKKLVVDLSQPGWKTKDQIYEWLTNETFD